MTQPGRKRYGLTQQQVCPICEGNGEVCVTCHRPHDACECPGADDLEPCVCSLPAEPPRIPEAVRSRITELEKEVDHLRAAVKKQTSLKDAARTRARNLQTSLDTLRIIQPTSLSSIVREVSHLVAGITPAYKNQQIAKEKALEILEKIESQE